MNHIRLRQVTVIARDLEPAVERMKGMLRLPEPFRDDLANQFATVNAVFQLGNSFVEIASPFEDGTVRRYAEARGGDAGYMAVFQVPDNEEARARVTELGIRIIAELKLFDQGGNLLHPKDVPGAMVTFDWSRPYEAWRWGGPAWSGRVPEHPEGGIVAMEVGMVDPVDAAEKWARALGVEVSSKTSTEAEVRLPEVDQVIRFTAVEDKLSEGIRGVELVLPSDIVVQPEFELAGVRFVVRTGGAATG